MRVPFEGSLKGSFEGSFEGSFKGSFEGSFKRVPSSGAAQRGAGAARASPAHAGEAAGGGPGSVFFGRCS